MTHCNSCQGGAGGLADLVTPELAAAALAEATGGRGCADLFAEARWSHAISVTDGRCERATTGFQSGLRIAVERADAVGVSTTEDVTAAGVFQAARRARAVADGRETQLLAELDHTARGPGMPMPPGCAATSWVDTAYAAEVAARAHEPTTGRVTIFLGGIDQQVVVADTTGRYASDRRRRTRARTSVIASRCGRHAFGVASAGATGHLDPAVLDVAAIAARAADQARRQLTARPIATGQMSIVLNAGAAGALVHEACGHGLEGDVVASGSSVFTPLLGRPVAASLVTIVDSGVVAGAWGSTTVDDEGTATGETVLIREGILERYLTDRRTASALGIQTSGNARRESYRGVAMPRMTNTFIARGATPPTEIIGDTSRGVFVDGVAGGQVDTSDGRVLFTVRDATAIQGGRLTHALEPFQLSLSGLDLLARVDAVGDDLAIVAGNCRRDGQRIFVGVGQPTVRLRAVTVS
ncbi:MAG: TldD/PmbA family protein [Acidimicrobiales bacterium]